MAEDKQVNYDMVTELTTRIVLQHGQIMADRIVSSLKEQFSSQYVAKSECETRRRDEEETNKKRFTTLLSLSISALVLGFFAAGLKAIELLSKLSIVVKAVGG
jgi:hypothetical protein